MNLEPVRRQNVSDGVFQQLLTNILEGETTTLPSERELAATLSVNRHAVREALKRLEQIGLVRIVHGGATEVLDLRTHAGLDILAYLAASPPRRYGPNLARSVLEFRRSAGTDAARLAALRATPETVADLERAAARYHREATRPEQLTVDREFWSLIIDASDNLAYRLAFNTLMNAFDHLPDMLALLLAPELDDPASHDALVRAIAEGDADGAAAHAHHLLSASSAVADQWLATLGGTGTDAQN
ncbi:GntR family transcriptional regulator [Nocardia sp. NPDC047648]|uniref:FadR/GntR family transcriptional regulator n=1 Tax=Nocardia sp. NPDC047648 TaxID=3155625 RepID=UPI003410BDED